MKKIVADRLLETFNEACVNLTELSSKMGGELLQLAQLQHQQRWVFMTAALRVVLASHFLEGDGK